MGRSNAAALALSEALRTFALGLPGAFEDYPWGERVAKVNKKVFVFLGASEPQQQEKYGIGMSVKLPESSAIALGLPFTEPTGYGLGKSGWVSVKFTPGDLPPLEMLQEWILESYRAVAPKKLAAQLDGAPAKAAPAKKAPAKKAPAKAAPAKAAPAKKAPAKKAPAKR